ncbi:hypothetical protein C8N31_103218 [Sulfitobacter mediterraneus]|uniref:Uncharacterized protein n=1 Tax=Sulfitobacter mediterraneus TaxID=83219 RepID=A0A2T6CGW9_9RHOB|nr:hypothetical protein Z950_767 [Sulfitobacter mediterraneus KCTC 32188]PTX74741.1 hypothetical protein C8N31_103218 [Sulfitobacter mediterraneus]
MWVWIIGTIVAVVAVISYGQYRTQKGTYRPLSSRQPARRAEEKTPLGMEALDMRIVSSATRRNESLERGQTNWTRKGFGFFTTSADTDIEPLADDETYAARYHTAFQKDQTKD